MHPLCFHVHAPRLATTHRELQILHPPHNPHRRPAGEPYSNQAYDQSYKTHRFPHSYFFTRTFLVTQNS